MSMNEEHPLVSIVIPLYKINPLFYNCLESIKQCTDYPNYEIIIIHSNGSFAENCNRGIKDSKGKYILLLNDDCNVSAMSTWLDKLVAVMESTPKCAAVSPMMLFPNKQVQFGGMVFHQDYCAGHLGWGWHIDDKRLVRNVHEFQATTFGCVLLRKKAINDVGLIDEEYKVAAYEDVDWCLRAKLRGWKILYQPNSIVWHYESQTFQTMDQKLRSDSSAENRKLYISRYAKYFKDGTFSVDDVCYPGGVWKGIVEREIK